LLSQSFADGCFSGAHVTDQEDSMHDEVISVLQIKAFFIFFAKVRKKSLWLSNRIQKACILPEWNYQKHGV
jgi:hypothetical protein